MSARTVALLALVWALAAGAQAAELTAAQRRAANAAGLPPSAVVFASPEMIVAIRDRGARSSGGGLFEGVTLQGEVISQRAGEALGYRSMRSTLKIDCVRRRDLVTRMTVYAQAGAKGLAIARQVPGDWAQPSPGAYLAAVNRAVCGTAPVVAETRGKALPRSRPETGRGEAAHVPQPAPPAAVTLSDDPDAPMATAIEAGFRTASARPPVLAASAAQPPALRGRVADPASPKPAARKPAPRLSTPGKVAVQVAASPTERQAKEALARLKGRIARPLSTEVQTAVVEGRTYHRAIVRGFQTRAEAQVFCASIGGGCFVR